MQIIAESSLRTFRERGLCAEAPLVAWDAVAFKANQAGPAGVKKAFGATMDFIGDNRVIFDIGSNEYRLIMHFACACRRGLIKFVGIRLPVAGCAASKDSESTGPGRMAPGTNQKLSFVEKMAFGCHLVTAEYAGW